MYEAQWSSRHQLPKHEIRVFIQQEKHPVLIALFSSINHQPVIGETLSIEFFKAKPEYPNNVRILGISEHFDVESGRSTPHVVFSITAEPVL